jgi:hypothetical protein
MLALLILACTGSTTLEGRVLDIWGAPVEGATVVVRGITERYQTDTRGVFRVEIPEELKVTEVMAGKNGYIKGVSETALLPDTEEYGQVLFKLYPEPEKPGFYAVGSKNYIHLKTARLVMVGTELKHHIGMREVPEAVLGGSLDEFVFTSTLRPSELAQMDLHLSELEFLSHMDIKGVLGAMDATVNLFVAKTEIPFDLKALPSKDDYLIQLREKLPPGTYAFHAQNVLNEPDYRKVMDLPKEMQVVYPFEIR